MNGYSRELTEGDVFEMFASQSAMERESRSNWSPVALLSIVAAVSVENFPTTCASAYRMHASVAYVSDAVQRKVATSKNVRIMSCVFLRIKKNSQSRQMKSIPFFFFRMFAFHFFQFKD